MWWVEWVRKGGVREGLGEDRKSVQVQIDMARRIRDGISEFLIFSIFSIFSIIFFSKRIFKYFICF